MEMTRLKVQRPFPTVRRHETPYYMCDRCSFSTFVTSEATKHSTRFNHTLVEIIAADGIDEAKEILGEILL